MEGVEGAPDWRALLDLLEARSGEDLTPLWREWVVGPADAALLDARAAARASYGRTLALADGWQLPRAIRDALRSWQFERAETLMADARTVLAQRKAVAEMAERDGVALTTTMQSPVREAASMAEASAHAEAQRDAIAGDRGCGEPLLGRRRHPEPDRHARGAPGADLAGRAARSRRTTSTVAGGVGPGCRACTVAWEEGRRRLLMALATLATVVVLGSAAVGTFRRSRRAAGSDGSTRPAAPGDGAAPA